VTEIDTAAADTLIRRIHEATNDHDLESLVACFDEEYISEMPVHPARDFRGREQVRTNWTQIFTAVPDLESRLLRSTVTSETAWAEWEWSGTRRDGAPHLMRGVTILGVHDGDASWARFYMEPVDQGGPDVDEAVRQVLGGPGSDR
jgi:ketosteroid isomerase-like protein